MEWVLIFMRMIHNYTTFDTSSPDDMEVAISNIKACIGDIEQWMLQNKLK